jgi:hypothetical protein
MDRPPPKRNKSEAQFSEEEKDDGGTSGPVFTFSGNRLVRAALSKKQREQFESNHPENQAKGKESEADHRRHKLSFRKRRKSLKKGAVWHIGPLLGNDRVISDYILAVAK